MWFWFGYSGLIKMSVGNANINFAISDVQLCLSVCVWQDKRNGWHCSQDAGQTADSDQRAAGSGRQTNHQKYAAGRGNGNDMQ